MDADQHEHLELRALHEWEAADAEYEAARQAYDPLLGGGRQLERLRKARKELLIAQDWLRWATGHWMLLD